MAELPADWTPPPRSILYVEYLAADKGVVVGCDCGAATHLVIEGAEKLTARTEMSFTCACLSVHWFTVGPAEAVTPGG